MPLREIDEERFLSVRALRYPEDETEPEDVRGFWDQLGAAIPAAWRRENSLGSALTRMQEGGFDFTVERPDFDPSLHIGGYESHARAFAFADSVEDVSAIKLRIDRETRDREFLLHADAPGVVAAIGMGVLDPLILLPIGGAAMKAAHGASLLRRGVLTAKAGFLGTSASELALQASQDTRTWGESALNVTAGTVLAGVFGSAVGVLGKMRQPMLKQIEEDFGAVAGGSGRPPLRVVPREDLVDDLPNEIELQGALGVEKLSARMHLSPSTWLLVRSRFQSARKAMVRLADVSPLLKHEGQGIATAPAVEAKIGLHRAMAGFFVREQKELYADYIGAARWKGLGSRITGRAPEGKLTWKQFRAEVEKAWSQSDTHAVPEVAEAAARGRKILDFYKARLQKQGRLEVGEDIVGAASYRPRFYNPKRMIQQQAIFKDMLVRKINAPFLRDYADGKITQAEVRAAEREGHDAAQRAYENIMGLGGRSFDRTLSVSGPKHLKERKITLSDTFLDSLGVLEQDSERTMRAYVDRMSRDVEIFEEFGSAGLADVKAAIQKEAAEQIEANPKDRVAIDKNLRETQENLDTVLTKLQGGTFGSSSPEYSLTRFMRGVRRANVPAMGGQFMLSALSDPGRIVMVHGLRRTLGSTALPLFRDLRGLSMSKHQLQLAGEAWDLTLEATARGIEDLGDEFGRHSTVERVIETAANTFSVISGLAPWNVAMKTFAAATTQTRIFEVATAVAKGGKASAKDLQAMAHLGLDETWLRKIAQEPWEESTVLRIADTERWTDAAVIERYRAALRKSVNEQIVTPGAGDIPRLAQWEAGKVAFQFKSYGFAAVNRLLIPGLQQRDFATLNGMAIMLGLGAITFAVKAKIAGRELPDPQTDLNIWIGEAVDRSGLLGAYADLNNITEKVTRGTVGLNAAFGGPVLSRYAQRNLLGTFLGPTAGEAEDLAGLVGAISAGEMTESDLHRARRMLWYQNHWATSRLFDAAERGAAKTLGIPER